MRLPSDRSVASIVVSVILVTTVGPLLLLPFALPDYAEPGDLDPRPIPTRARTQAPALGEERKQPENREVMQRQARRARIDPFVGAYVEGVSELLSGGSMVRLALQTAAPGRYLAYIETETVGRYSCLHPGGRLDRIVCVGAALVEGATARLRLIRIGKSTLDQTLVFATEFVVQHALLPPAETLPPDGTDASEPPQVSTPTPVVSQTPTPTPPATLEDPTRTPRPSNTPRPTNTHRPDNTPRSSNTPKPTHTPKPKNDSDEQLPALGGVPAYTLATSWDGPHVG